MGEKIIKPPSCAKCPAVKTDKNTIYCSCMRELKAVKTDFHEQDIMYEKCPIDWDTKENK